jgi:hypothetical protein
MRGSLAFGSAHATSLAITIQEDDEMQVRTVALIGIAALAISACAKSPDAIQASYVSEVPYLSWTCPQLSEETQRLSGALARASAQQERARGNDIAGVIFLGFPVSSLSGDNVAPEVARLKGEEEAVRKAMIRKNCI